MVVLSPSQQPWVEKYRPSKVEEIVGQWNAVSLLSRCSDQNQWNEFPNLLLYGPPGTGKTSAIMSVCRKLYGKQMRERVLELNASHERGIGVIRQKVKLFAQLSTGQLDRSTPVAPFKMIVLDECDAMTYAAQTALRRTMELHCRTTRFCLICNYPSRIIEPIKSRCSRFRFSELPPDLAHKRLLEICEAEEVRLVNSEQMLKYLLEGCQGDLRHAINTLQCIVSTVDGEVNILHMEEALGIIPRRVMDSIISHCWLPARPPVTKAVTALVDGIVREGFSVGQVIRQLQESLLAIERNSCGSDVRLTKALLAIGQAEERCLDGADEYLTLFNLLLAL